MSKNGSRSRRYGFGVLLALVIIAGVLVYLANHHSKTDPSITTSNTGSQTYAETADIKYTVPTGWTSVSKEVLDTTGAISGIARTSEPEAHFTVTIEPAVSTPATAAALKSDAMAALSKFDNFELVSYTTPTVNTQPGQQFVYKFGTTEKTKQQLLIVVYQKRAFSFLFTSALADFDGQQVAFDQIIASITFK